MSWMRTFSTPLRHAVQIGLVALIGLGVTLTSIAEAYADTRVKAAIIVDANTNNVL